MVRFSTLQRHLPQPGDRKRYSLQVELMPAVLRISGPFEQLGQSMLAVPFPFEESIASRRRRERGQSAEGSATFNLTISESDGDRVPAQIEESLLFLSKNKDAINAIQGLAGVQDLCVDFSWDFPSNSIGQYNRFPASLAKLCGSLGIDIKVSVYATLEGGVPDDPKRE